jgi:hypothetical protein
MQALNLTEAMQAILLHRTRGYVLWLGFKTTVDKLPALDEKFALELGTHEPGWKRVYRKRHGIPNAVAVASKVFGEPSIEVILMATEQARKVDPSSAYKPFLRQQWRDDLPRLSHFEMVHMPTEATGKWRWTWRIRKSELNQIESYLVRVVDARDSALLRRELQQLLQYPMFSGVRSQIRRLLRRIKRRCELRKVTYTGPDPENLPAMIGWRASRPKPSGSGHHSAELSKT